MQRLLGLIGFVLSMMIAPVYAATDISNTSDHMRIMTFNLRVETRSDGDNQWINRRTAAADLMKSAAPAVIGTQEGTYPMILDLEEFLPDYSWVGQGRDGGIKGEFGAVFYRKDVLEVVNSGDFWLSNEPARPGSRYPSVSLPRMATWVHFRVKGTNQEFLFYNTHFDHLSQPGREFEAKTIRQHLEKQLKEKGIPGVITGDLNCTSTNKAISILQTSDNGQKVLTNAVDWAFVQGAWVGATFHGFKGTLSGEPIDHIFYTTGWQIGSFSILNQSVRDRYPSDHYPVMIELKLL